MEHITQIHLKRQTVRRLAADIVYTSAERDDESERLDIESLMKMQVSVMGEQQNLWSTSENKLCLLVSDLHRSGPC